MLLGIPFHMALMRFTSGKSLGVRLGFATVLALLLVVCELLPGADLVAADAVRWSLDYGLVNSAPMGGKL